MGKEHFHLFPFAAGALVLLRGPNLAGDIRAFSWMLRAILRMGVNQRYRLNSCSICGAVWQAPLRRPFVAPFCRPVTIKVPQIAQILVMR